MDCVSPSLLNNFDGNIRLTCILTVWRSRSVIYLLVSLCTLSEKIEGLWSIV